MNINNKTTTTTNFICHFVKNTNFGSGTRFWWRFRRMYTCFRNRKSASTSKEFFRTRKYIFRPNQTQKKNTVHTKVTLNAKKK